jgi:hypothetical protein
MKTRNWMAVGLLAVVRATPAAANYFSNPMTNMMLNVGSAPSPTPEQLRLIGDSVFTAQVSGPLTAADMIGKNVYGKSREFLGKITAVDEVNRLADMQTPTGVVVALSTHDLIDRSDRVMAPNMSRGDVIALAGQQGPMTAPIEVTD